MAKDTQTNGDRARVVAQELVDAGVAATITGDGTAISALNPHGS